MDTIRKLLRLSRQEWPLLGWGFLFLALSSAAMLAYPHSIKKIIDEALTHRDQDQLNAAALLALGIFLVHAVTSALRYYFFTLAGERTVRRLRLKLFSNILTQDMSFFDQHKTGELMGRLSSDTSVLQNALSVNISMLVRFLVQASGALVMLFVTSTKLTLFIFILVPPLGWLAARFGKNVKAMSRRVQDTLAHTTAVAEEGLSNVRTVKAFAQENFEIGRMDMRLEASYQVVREKISVIAKFTNLVTMLGLSAVVFIVWFGGTMVIKGEMSVGTLTSFLLYVITVAFSVGMLGSLWTDFMSAIGASGRILELLEKSHEDVDQGLKEFGAGKINFNHVHFTYPARTDFAVLKGISFEIEPGETVAVVGPSGAGKSTLVQLLMGFYPIQQGEILFDGVSREKYSLRTLRSTIGLVSQEPVLVSESLLDNIRYGRPSASEAEVIAAAKLAYAHEFIMQFPQGYATMVGERGVQLSGGQKQRVAIARALLKDPKILILDEATSALDAESEHLVQRALDNLIVRRTTLIIAHRLSTVKKADRIIVIQDGQVVQIGSHQALMQESEGLYLKLVQRQFEHTKESP